MDTMKQSIERKARSAFLTLFGTLIAGSALSQNDVTVESMKNRGYLPDSMQTEQLSELSEGTININGEWIDNDRESFYAFRDTKDGRADYIVFGNNDASVDIGEKSQYIFVGYTDDEQEVMDSTRRFLNKYSGDSSDISTYVFQAKANKGSQASVSLDGDEIKSTTIDSTNEWLTDYVAEGSSEEFEMRIKNSDLNLDTTKTMTLTDLDTLKLDAYIGTGDDGDSYSYTIPLKFNEGTEITSIDTAKSDTLFDKYFGQAGDTTITYNTENSELPMRFIASRDDHGSVDTTYNFTPGTQDTVDLRLNGGYNTFAVSGQVVDSADNQLKSRYVVTEMSGDTLQDDSTSAQGQFLYEITTPEDTVERILNFSKEGYESLTDTLSVSGDTSLTYQLQEQMDTSSDLFPIEEEKKEPEVYPNPFDNRLNVELPEQSNGRANVSLYNLAGREVYTNSHAVNDGNMKINFGDQNLEGMYILRVQSDNQEYTTKVLNK